MSKTAVGILYILGILGGIATISFFLTLSDYNRLEGYAATWIAEGVSVEPHVQDHITQDQIILLILIAIMIIGGISGMVGWIGTLVNLARAQLWAWFILTFFFSGIMLFIYLIAGPQPLKPGQSPQQQFVYVPPSAPSGVSVQPPSSQPSQPVSALEMLRQRYVRGEIDEATFDRMRARLEG
jgi:hypothetical protein